jgi:hypothetical protein
MDVGMTRNPMRLTGTITALSALARSSLRQGHGHVLRAFTPGCFVGRQSGPKQPD